MTQSAPIKGAPRAGGRLARFIVSQDPALLPVYEGDHVYVSVEGTERKAVIDRADFLRLTDKHGLNLTRTRWWLDEAGMLRAYTHKEKPKVTGHLVAAEILGARDGDQIEAPEDPLDLRRKGLRLIRAPKAA